MVSVNRIPVFRCVLILLFAAAIGRAQAPDAGGNGIDPGLALELDFEAGPPGAMPGGWGGGPEKTISNDETITHSGKRSVRIERVATSERNFTTITKMLPMDFAGKEIELRGFVRTENISGFVGLWLREDGAQPNLAFDNMQKREVKGTTDWTEYSINLSVHPDGRRLVFGFLASGTGRAWVDGLQLLVDGKPIWQAPKAQRALTVLDQDHEFDAGSKISLTALTPTQVDNLVTLGKVWGFLKYHHPKVTSGEVHWDYELFRIMPVVLAAPDRTAANAALLRWIETLGETKAGEARAELVEAELHLRPANRWIEDETRLGQELSQRLRGIYQNRPKAGGQFYVSQFPNVGNPVFDRELGYAQVKSPDAGYQLLGLFRYWNIIQYWFPYRDVIGEDWEAVLAAYVPRLALAATADDYKREMLTLIARIHDTHANLWSSLAVRPPVGDSEVPVVVRFVEGKAVVAEIPAVPGSPASLLQRGDIIEAIDGVPVADLVKTWTPYYAASNEPTRLRDMARSLTLGPAGEVKLTVRRAGEVLAVSAVRQPVKELRDLIPRTHDLPGEAFRLLSKDVAYLKLSAVKDVDLKDCIKRAAGTKGLVIDIRNYPSAFVVFTLGSLLMDQPREFVRFTKGDLASPGAFSFTPSLTVAPAQPRYAGRVIILLDEVSQSNAEYTAMAFRAVPGAVVVGSTTAGADGNVSRIPLPGGLSTMISGIGVFYPDKRPTQQVGIVPDIEVKPTIEGIKAGRDELLEEAVRQILGPEMAPADFQAVLREAGRTGPAR